MQAVKLRTKISGYLKYIIPIAIILFCLIWHIVFKNSVALCDLFNFAFSSFLRSAMAFISSFIPFSLGETLIVVLPLLFAVVVFAAIKKRDNSSGLLCILLCVLAFMYFLFVFAVAPSYGTTSADTLFSIDAKPIKSDEIYKASQILAGEINDLADEIDYNYGSFSKMNYSLDTLSEKLMTDYDTLCGKYPFLKNFKSRLKPIALSEPMTYTHISGVYTYYTGETNINTNFPDYSLPYTSAHEMAHQRGFGREREANLVAFLVCEGSRDPYIRYSGKLTMLDYLGNVLAAIDPELYREIFYSLDIRVRCELVSYSDFFEKYRNSTASEISGAVNDIYLKANGQKEGEKSYGLVVDAATNYILSKNED